MLVFSSYKVKFYEKNIESIIFAPVNKMRVKNHANLGNYMDCSRNPSFYKRWNQLLVYQQRFGQKERM